MMNPSIPPLPPNRPYHRPLNYLEYAKDFDPNAHVRVFKAIIRANGETKDVEIVNLFNFTLKDIVSDSCIMQMVTRQIIMLKHVKSKERKTLFLQSLRLLFNKLKYRGL